MITVVLALLGALFYSLSDYMQQSTAASVERSEAAKSQTPTRRGEQVRELFADIPHMARASRWWWGWVVGTFAFGLQGAALYSGSVSVVQPLQVSALLFALPLSTRGNPEKMRPVDWVAGGSVCVGLAMFLLARGSPAHSGSPPRGRLLGVIGLIACATVALLVVAVARRGPSRALTLATAAGTCFAASATLTKLTATDLTSIGIGGTAADWPGYLLAASTGAGVLIEQAAFAAGRLAVAATALVITNPVLGAVISVVGWGEPLPGDPLRLAAIAAGGLLVVAGVHALSHAPVLAGSQTDDPKDELCCAH